MNKLRRTGSWVSMPLRCFPVGTVMRRGLAYAGLVVMMLVMMPGVCFAQEAAAEAQAHDSGNTAWMLMSTALVLFMTIPGLALFYGGLVRSKNVLSVLMQCFGITCLVTILWLVYGYSLAFDNTGMVEGELNLHSFIGGFGKLFLSGVAREDLSGTFPETIFFCFQMTFAIITPALVVGAFAERMKFSAVLIFTALWLTLVYAPICHMVWGGPGSLVGSHWGALDFAGGTVVHINAGIAGLLACIMVGKRKGFPTTAMPPHNVAMCVTGAAMLWVGWFGFNAGSELAADGIAGMAMLVTQVATATAAFTWMLCEWVKHGKPSAVGIATGAVAGLVAITPASGTVGPIGALAIGVAAGLVCFVASTSMKRRFGYDDSLDVFGVHGVGGIVGALLTGVFASQALGGTEDIIIIEQFLKQVMGAGFTVVWCGVITFVLLKGIDLTLGLRVEEQHETEGLDIALHSESGYNL